MIAKLKIVDNGTDVCHAKRGKTHTHTQKRQKIEMAQSSYIFIRCHRRVRNSQRRKNSSVLYNGSIRMYLLFFFRTGVFLW